MNCRIVVVHYRSPPNHSIRLMDQPDVQMAEYLLERQNNSHEPQAGADGNDIRILLQQHLDQIDIKIRVAVQEELQKRIIVPESGNLEEPAKPGLMGALVNRVTGQVSSHNQSPPYPHAEAISRMNELTARIDSLSLELGEKKSEIDQLKWNAEIQQQNFNAQLYNEQQKFRQLNERIANLRSMLIKPSTVHVIDSAVIAKFSSLASQIIRIVRGTYGDKLVSPLSQTNQVQYEFFSPWKQFKRPKKYLANRVRGEIFNILCVRIISRPFFGYDRTLSKYDEDLETLEGFFWKKLKKENLKDFVEWRSASIKCGELVKGETKMSDSNIAADTAQYIWEFLKPLEIKDAAAGKKCQELLLKLCEDALALSALMRSARDVFRVLKKFEGPLTGHLEFADEEADEKADSKDTPVGDVAFCLFGALVKRTEEDPLKLITLEKARLVVYRD
ncbi:hypothetical protein B0O99DRAFT_671908 [Bisporella sp. PMI_857]|nr:hypothetical protein B0O99DRAFT_671908 [Bisporella sp. PMI_857]